MKDEISVLDGSTFFVSDERGDALGIKTHGLFHHDTRFLSTFRVEIDGRTPYGLSAYEIDYYSASFFMSADDPGFGDRPGITVQRNRFVGGGLHEDLMLINHSDREVHLDVLMTFAADFADFFQVKDQQIIKRGDLAASIEDGTLAFIYRREDFVRQTHIAFTETAALAPGQARFAVTLAPGEKWKTCIIISLNEGEEWSRPKYTCNAFGIARPQTGVSFGEWIERSPALDCDWDLFNHTYSKSIVDLAALCFRIMPEEEERPPAAGLPWFMTLFGRDSLITGYQCMVMGDGMAAAALRVLARRQAGSYDDFHDSEPGKIMHELRFGELTVFGERPHDPYYGSIDSTILFLILLHEHYLWTGSFDMLRELEPQARLALAWIDQYGDFDGDGYVEYQRRSNQGLDNQCWKDSFNSIVFPDGSLASPPLATAEVQGYVHDAWSRLARVAAGAWGDPELARRLEARAKDLKHRFNKDYWVDVDNFFALALDGRKQPVASAASNMGHLLWSGIVDSEKAAYIAERLMAPELWSGWGVRTLSSRNGAYSPLAYHNGTVWPHDNSLIAAGLARYGFREEAGRIAISLIEASRYFAHRLPEAFAGYDRADTHFPVSYPTACIPQAWATATPLLLIRTILGLEPDPEKQELRLDPFLVPPLKRISLRGVNAFGRRWDIEAQTGSESSVSPK